MVSPNLNQPGSVVTPSLTQAPVEAAPLLTLPPEAAQCERCDKTLSSSKNLQMQKASGFQFLLPFFCLILTSFVPLVQLSHVPGTGLDPSYLFPPLLGSAPVPTSAALPLVSQPAPATCAFSYLSARKTDYSSLSLANRNKSVQSQQHNGQVMAKATAVIFWWMTQICQVQQHQQHQGSSAQDCLVGPSLQHPPAGGAQPAPAPARWDQEMASSSRSLGEGLPPGS